MRTLSFDGPTAAPQAVVRRFEAALRAEQLRHLDALRRACAMLDGHSGRLPVLAGAHSALTRQWFDAQRSLLGRCAEIDAQVEGADAPDVWVSEMADDMAAAQRQLGAVLDSWWAVENDRSDRCLAVREAQQAVTQELPAVTAVVTTALPADVLAVLEPIEATGADELTDVASVLDALADLLRRPTGTAAPVHQETDDGRSSTAPVLMTGRDLEIRLDPLPPAVPPPPSRTRRRRRSRGIARPVGRSLVMDIVVPMAATAAVLVVLLAWIG